jgi:hypothetical protein
MSLELLGFVSVGVLTLILQRRRSKVNIDGEANSPGIQIRRGYDKLIGNTPLIKLAGASKLTGCTILLKVLISLSSLGY